MTTQHKTFVPVRASRQVASTNLPTDDHPPGISDQTTRDISRAGRRGGWCFSVVLAAMSLFYFNVALAEEHQDHHKAGETPVLGSRAYLADMQTLAIGSETNKGSVYGTMPGKGDGNMNIDDSFKRPGPDATIASIKGVSLNSTQTLFEIGPERVIGKDGKGYASQLAFNFGNMELALKDGSLLGLARSETLENFWNGTAAGVPIVNSNLTRSFVGTGPGTSGFTIQNGSAVSFGNVEKLRIVTPQGDDVTGAALDAQNLKRNAVLLDLDGSNKILVLNRVDGQTTDTDQSPMQQLRHPFMSAAEGSYEFFPGSSVFDNVRVTYMDDDGNKRFYYKNSGALEDMLRITDTDRKFSADSDGLGWFSKMKNWFQGNF